MYYLVVMYYCLLSGLANIVLDLNDNEVPYLDVNTNYRYAKCLISRCLYRRTIDDSVPFALWF